MLLSRQSKAIRWNGIVSREGIILQTGQAGGGPTEQVTCPETCISRILYLTFEMRYRLLQVLKASQEPKVTVG